MSAQALIEAGALRQFRHNDGSEGFVAAYDKDITDRVFALLEPNDRSLWTATHNGQYISAGTLSAMIVEARKLRTPAEQETAALNLKKAIDGDLEAGSEGWKEAAIAWSVCASVHAGFSKGKDPFFSTRQSDFVRHEANARALFNGVAGDIWRPTDCPPPDNRQVLVELTPPKRKSKNCVPVMEVGLYFRPEPGIHDDDDPCWFTNNGVAINVARWRYI